MIKYYSITSPGQLWHPRQHLIHTHCYGIRQCIAKQQAVINNRPRIIQGRCGRGEWSEYTISKLIIIIIFHRWFIILSAPFIVLISLVNKHRFDIFNILFPFVLKIFNNCFTALFQSWNSTVYLQCAGKSLRQCTWSWRLTGMIVWGSAHDREDWQGWESEAVLMIVRIDRYESLRQCTRLSGSIISRLGARAAWDKEGCGVEP